METIGFLTSQGSNINKLSITSWNINGIGNKLENDKVQNFLCEYDIVMLNELKTPCNFSLPGYKLFRSTGQSQHRGGCAVLIKNRLANEIIQMVTTDHDCVYFKLRFMQNVIFVASYIPPGDSPFFKEDTLGCIQELIKCNPDDQLILLGDLNARFGASRDLFLQNTLPEMTYLPSQDRQNIPNSNARLIAHCLSDLVLLNNLKFRGHVFNGAQTFRQGTKWISELDVCLVSPSVLHAIDSFHVHKEVHLPSNHAPISVTMDVTKIEGRIDTERLLIRAGDLGSYPYPSRKVTMCKRQIRMRDVDTQKALDILLNVQPPEIDALNIDTTVETMNSILYECVTSSEQRVPRDVRSADRPSRWCELLKNNDDRMIWQAIDWGGRLQDEHKSGGPSDVDFKEHFEKLLHPEDVEPLDPTSVLQNMPQLYVPITDDVVTPVEVDDAVKNLKANKSGGPSGIPPGILKYLPVTWVIMLASLFSWILQLHTYPSVWSYTRLVTLFKKGSRTLCDNYRGISIMDRLVPNVAVDVWNIFYLYACL